MLQVPGDEHEWRGFHQRNKAAGSFAKNKPFPLWLAVDKPLYKCVLGAVPLMAKMLASL